MIGSGKRMEEAVTLEHSVVRDDVCSVDRDRSLSPTPNAVAPAPSESRLIHEIFEAQVERAPDAIAVVHGKQAITYGELNGRANELARYLRARGVRSDEVVALCVER